MPSKKSKSKIAPVAEDTTPVAPPAVAITEPAKKEPAVVPVEKKTQEEAHFDVAQNVYGTAKNVWAWGKTVPVMSTFLGLTETVATKVLDTTIHMDLPAIDEKAVTPNLKKLDDDIVTPMILAVWKIVEPAVVKGEELVIKPVLTEVVPRVLAPLGMFDKKKEDEKKTVDASPTPEVIPALN